MTMADELFTRRLPLKIGNEQRCQPLPQTQQGMYAHRLTQKNIEFLQFDMAVAHNFFIE